jgi:hypothetical protein
MRTILVRLSLVASLVLQLVVINAIVAQPDTEDELLSPDCDSAYNEHFALWLGYLNSAGAQPPRPDSGGSCYTELLQAQADAFSAWTATSQAPSPPAAPPQPEISAPPSVPSSTVVTQPSRSGFLTLADLPPGFEIDGPPTAEETGGGTFHTMVYALPNEQALTHRGAFIVATMIFEGTPSSPVGAGSAQSVLAQTIRQRFSDTTMRQTTGPQIGTNTQWFRGTMRSGALTADAYAVVFRVNDTAAAVLTVTLAGRGGQEDAARYGEVVAARIAGGAVAAPSAQSSQPPSSTPESGGPTALLVGQSVNACSIRGVLLQVRVVSILEPTGVTSGSVWLLVEVTNAGSRADDLFRSIELVDQRGRRYTESPDGIGDTTYFSVLRTLRTQGVVSDVTNIEPGRTGVVLASFLPAPDSQSLRLAAATGRCR